MTRRYKSTTKPAAPVQVKVEEGRILVHQYNRTHREKHTLELDEREARRLIRLLERKMEGE